MSSIDAQHTIDELTRQNEHLKKNINELVAVKDDYIRQRNYLAEQLDKVQTEQTELKEDLDFMISLNESNFNEVNLQIQKICQLKEENEGLIDKSRSLCETVSRLELQLQSYKDEHCRLANQVNTTNIEIVSLKEENKQLQKDNKTLTAISLDSLISINQLLSKNY